MSMIYCPECGHEVSALAVSCPNCGHPFRPEPPVPKVIVSDIPPTREGFPNWAFVPLGILGALALFFIFFLIMRGGSENDNVNVNLSARRQANTTRSTQARDSEPQPAAPSSSSDEVQTRTVPGLQTEVETRPDRGSAMIDARVINRAGNMQAVKGERFYLLDDDLESILNDAGLEPIEGQTITESLGLAVMQPSQHSDFHRKAMAAIKNHIKYSVTTDGSGKAELRDIKPDSYYLFGITKTSEGFAVWNWSVNISEGQNNLNLSPQRLEQISG